jgi:hypothetical protein
MDISYWPDLDHGYVFMCSIVSKVLIKLDVIDRQHTPTKFIGELVLLLDGNVISHLPSCR